MILLFHIITHLGFRPKTHGGHSHCLTFHGSGKLSRNGQELGKVIYGIVRVMCIYDCLCFPLILVIQSIFWNMIYIFHLFPQYCFRNMHLNNFCCFKWWTQMYRLVTVFAMWSWSWRFVAHFVLNISQDIARVNFGIEHFVNLLS